ncbi:hypothetical protein KGP36_02685 [Patescibacteria group bacterium]|nr:hypothetical protein [Patescibacteria group bacterium]
MNVKCADCYYWEKNVADNFGWCHKNPPVVLGWTEMNAREGWSEFKTGTFVPEPHGDFWCDSYLNKERAIESERVLDDVERSLQKKYVIKTPEAVVCCTCGSEWPYSQLGKPCPNGCGDK